MKSAELLLDVRKGLKDDKLRLRVMVVDEKLDENVSEELELPVQVRSPTQAPARGTVRVNGVQALLHAGASADSEPVAIAKKGAVLPVNGRFGPFYRVEWRKGRFGFVEAPEVTAMAGSGRKGSIVAVWQREPPRIAISPDPARGAPVVDADTWRLEGSASLPPSPIAPDKRLRDVFIYVNEHKVFFKVAPTKSGTSTRMDFAADVPLKVGNNVVTVFAREDEEFQSRRTIIVHRRAPAEVLQRSE